ncbi:MAG: helix-hairpin-helix domain-containing protein [Ferruginibacter sp.]
MQKRPTNNYFNFTRKERNGTIFLLIVILLLTAIPFIYPLVFKEKIILSEDIQNELTALKAKQKDSTKRIYRENFDQSNYKNYYRARGEAFHDEPLKAVLFNFDPNTISAEGWKKLGIRDKTISTIRNFIAKGGKFRQPEDLKKIWGLHEDDVQRLMPFVNIAEKNSSPVPAVQITVSNKYEQKKSFEMTDINLADTSALIRLPGIGTKLSNRIINFRDKLGGFYSIEQVAETFGLPDSVYQRIRPALQLREKKLKQININTALLDELKQHPYIRYNLANLIIQYRTQHGNFASIADIKRIMTVTDELYDKLSPYLTIQ